MGQIIPKIIHYCWLGDKSFGPTQIKCINSWKKKLPDYEFKLWDKKSFDINSVPFVKSAIDQELYAFASDYIRVYALYHYGGIYLDCDVEVYKNFDDFLDLPYALCIERDDYKYVEPAIMVFERKHPYLKILLDEYEKLKCCRYSNDLIMPPFITKIWLNNGIKLNYISYKEEFDNSDNICNVFSKDYFSPKNYLDGKTYLSNNTVCCHLFEANWYKFINNNPNKFKSINNINDLEPCDKIINIVWFGNSPIYDKYFESIRKYLPGWELKIWTDDDFKTENCKYFIDKIYKGEYAYASDYARYKILYEHGGIYIDTDVEFINSIDDLLKDNKSFLATERICNRVAGGLIMYFAKKHHPVMKYCVDYYKENKYNENVIVDGEVLAKGLELYYDYQRIDINQEFDDIKIFDSSYFNSNENNENSKTIHHYTNFWNKYRYEKINSPFDKIYCINLISNKDRREFMESQFKSIGIDVMIFPAIDYKNILHSDFYEENNEVYHKCCGTKISNYPLMRYPEAGCAISHYSCVKDAYERGYNRILILEDDVCFNIDNRKINYYFNHIPNDANIVFFNFNCGYKPDFTHEYTKINHLDNITCAAAYSLDRKAMEYYINEQEKEFKGADLINGIFKNINNSELNIYTTKEAICMTQIFFMNMNDIVCPHNIFSVDFYQPNTFLKSTLRDNR